MYPSNDCYHATITGHGTRGDIDEATTTVLVASRALVGVAARSLAAIEADLTLPQYRALVLLQAHGEVNVGRLAEGLGIHPSTATRLCDRLVAKRVIERRPATKDRRAVTVRLAPKGREIVRLVTARRRRELRRIVARLEPGQRRSLAAALASFSIAAGELPDDAWKIGWSR